MARSAIDAHRPFVSIGQAAEYAGVSPKTIRRRISDGSLPAVRMGPRAIRVRLSDVDQLMHPVPSANPSGTHATGGRRGA